MIKSKELKTKGKNQERISRKFVFSNNFNFLLLNFKFSTEV